MPLTIQSVFPLKIVFMICDRGYTLTPSVARLHLIVFEIQGLAQGLAYARRGSLFLLLLSLFLMIDYTANLFN